MSHLVDDIIELVVDQHLNMCSINLTASIKTDDVFELVNEPQVNSFLVFSYTDNRIMVKKFLKEHTYLAYLRKQLHFYYS